MDYNSLTNDIQSWANRNEAAFVAQIPTIIENAMLRIYTEGESIGFQKVAAGNMQLGNPNIVKPQDFLKPVSLQFAIPGTVPFRAFLLERSYEFCITYAPNPNLRGQPVFYSTDLIVPPNVVAQAQIFIAPTPDDNYQYSLTYSSLPPLFNAQNPTNYVTDRHPNLLRYACFLDAAIYLKSDERIPVFESLFKNALHAMNKDTAERRIDRTSKRDIN